MTFEELKFKAKDFKNVTLGHHGATPTIEQNAANIANRILEEKLKRAPIVYQSDELAGAWFKKSKPYPLDTHQARLVCVEEIK